MNITVAMRAFQVIKSERDSRASRLSNDDPDYAYDQWLFTEAPFISDMCLTLLVAVHHQVERDLLRLSARCTTDGADLTGEQYRQRIEDARNQLRARGGRRSLIDRLQLESVPDWTSMETLRLLANSHKHNPDSEPDQDLLKHLGRDLSVAYAPLPESDAIREALAASLGLPNADLCDIGEELLARAERFLVAAANAQPQLSRVRWGPVSFRRDRLLH
jgi:hypothetical protein